jgi:hypothetical protein
MLTMGFDNNVATETHGRNIKFKEEQPMDAFAAN